jgi:hypothetical protein
MSGPNGGPIVLRITPGPIEITVAPGTPADQINHAIAAAYQQSCDSAAVAVHRELAVQTRVAR